MREPGSLNGIPAFVTGGSRGIGAAIAQNLATAGAAVAIGYRNRAAQAEQVATSITTAGGTAICIPGDVSDENEVDQAFARIEAELGPVGILVNNAGAHRGGRVQKLALDDWRLVHNASLTSAFLCARRAVPLMIERRWGRIINVTSVVGLNGFPGDAAYASAKAGLIGLTKALALELARDQITVTAVAPGFVDTEMTRGLAPSIIERIERTIPAHRQATADEIAQTVGFLAAGPDYITGTVIVVDGGWRIA
ncbi:beta-ketoacyl-ACP reductase [Mycobacterium saskatchewanense]|uniref:3-oxoacyl-ACP reductase family protein n=1 Tax=Mycobacterium saskatchewanense TaxID=220927 RepID=UPI0004AE6909|nr:3-oxoacyl-ACP reductase family protein [Mycobacterium saskatchewanense]BBX65327.1 beta-ketoacyl-ACP reductase [Mycobacterium saskatchewanense]